MKVSWGRRVRGRMVVGFTTTYAITTDVVSSNLDQGRGAQHYIICDKVFQ